MRNLAIGMALAFSLAATPAAWATDTSDPTLSTPPTQAVGAEQSRLDAALEKAGNGVQTGLIEDVRAVVDDPAFAGLPSDRRFLALKLLGAVLYDAKDMSGAHAALVRATQMDEADQAAWKLRFYSADDADKAENLLCLTVIANRWPEALGDVKASYIGDLVRDTADKPPLANARQQAMAALWSAHWPGDQSDYDADFIWKSLVDLYLDQGQTDKALAVAQSVSTPRNLILFSVDHRYDRLRQGLSDHLDISKAQALYSAHLKAVADAHPDSLDAINNLVWELRSEARLDDALGLIQTTESRINAAPSAKPAFSDTASRLAWLENNKAYILNLLGREQEAVTALQAATKLPDPDDGNNVSEVINLGAMLVNQGHPQEGLEAVAHIRKDDASMFGWMQAWDVRACAYAQLHDTAQFQAQLKLLLAHEADAPGALQDAYDCADDLDDEAAVLIRRLNNPDQRPDALLSSQTYVHPGHDSAIEAAAFARWKRLVARPDVQKALAAAGRIIDIPRYDAD